MFKFLRKICNNKKHYYTIVSAFEYYKPGTIFSVNSPEDLNLSICSYCGACKKDTNTKTCKEYQAEIIMQKVLE